MNSSTPVVCESCGEARRAAAVHEPRRKSRHLHVKHKHNRCESTIETSATLCGQRLQSWGTKSCDADSHSLARVHARLLAEAASCANVLQELAGRQHARAAICRQLICTKMHKREPPCMSASHVLMLSLIDTMHSCMIRTASEISAARTCGQMAASGKHQVHR